MTDIIITDLTRFSNRGLLCTAGLTLDGTTCIRPLLPYPDSYFSYEDCKTNNVLPGTILRAQFVARGNTAAPHVEDMEIASDISIEGMASSDEFEAVLRASAVNSIAAGFGVPVNTKKIAVTGKIPVQSIITLSVQPKNFTVLEDNYGKLRAHVTDATGTRFEYLSVTDLGFFDNVGNPDTRRLSAADALSNIRQQTHLYLRVGLSRAHEGSYWLQVNGIYTFPNYNLVVRQY